MSESNQDKVDIEDIQAEVSKHNAKLVFVSIALLMCLMGFFVKTCADMPAQPRPLDPSIECAKVPGAQWVPIEFKVVDGRTMEIPAYCSTKKIQQ
jgi:hypothetical protein